jgi:hypothetical protein
MHKFAIPAVAAAALLAMPAIAADQPRDQQAQQTQPGAQQQHMQQEGVGQRQPQAGEHELINMEVVGQGGEEVGQITNVLVDEQGQVKAVIIEHGTAVLGIGGQKVAVPYERLQLPEARPGMADDERQARIDMTEEQLGELPEYEGHDNGMMQRDQRDQPGTQQQPGAQPGQPGQPGTQQPGQQR